jgi:hypothetical protein
MILSVAIPRTYARSVAEFSSTCRKPVSSCFPAKKCFLGLEMSHCSVSSALRFAKEARTERLISLKKCHFHATDPLVCVLAAICWKRKNPPGQRPGGYRWTGAMMRTEARTPPTYQNCWL